METSPWPKVSRWTRLTIVKYCSSELESTPPFESTILTEVVADAAPDAVRVAAPGSVPIWAKLVDNRVAVAVAVAAVVPAANGGLYAPVPTTADVAARVAAMVLGGAIGSCWFGDLALASNGEKALLHAVMERYSAFKVTVLEYQQAPV